MNALKKSLLCAGLLLSVGVASAACDSKQSITVSVGDTLNESQQSESLIVQFVKGPRVSFTLTQANPSQSRKVKLPMCDNYSYTISGNMKFLKNDPEWKGASLPLRGKQDIQLKDGDELIVWGDFSSTSVKAIDAMLGPKNMMDQQTPPDDTPQDDASPTAQPL